MAKVTDTNGVLFGHIQTVGSSGQNNNTSQTTPYAVDVTGGDNLTADFGYYLEKPDGVLSVSLSYAFAERKDDGPVHFTWETATETGNAGFNLYMGDRRQILVPGECEPDSLLRHRLGCAGALHI